MRKCFIKITEYTYLYHIFKQAKRQTYHNKLYCFYRYFGVSCYNML